MEPINKACLVCGQGANTTPLITLEYRNSQFWICPRHMPLLIHDPAKLVGLLPGAEDLSPAANDD